MDKMAHYGCSNNYNPIGFMRGLKISMEIRLKILSHTYPDM